MWDKFRDDTNLCGAKTNLENLISLQMLILALRKNERLEYRYQIFLNYLSEPRNENIYITMHNILVSAGCLSPDRQMKCWMEEKETWRRN